MEVLRHLNKMNINPMTLFPDIQGVSAYAGLCALDSSYTGHTMGKVAMGMYDTTWTEILDKLHDGE